MFCRKFLYLKSYPAAFISYKRTDGKSLPLLIQNQLVNKGFYAICDINIPAGAIYEDYLLKAIRRSPNFILIQTPEIFSDINNPNNWVRKEIKTALENKKNVISILVDQADAGNFQNTPLPEDIDGIRNHQVIFYYQNQPHAAWDNIINSLVKTRTNVCRFILLLFVFLSFPFAFFIYFTIPIYKAKIVTSIPNSNQTKVSNNKSTNQNPGNILDLNKTKDKKYIDKKLTEPSPNISKIINYLKKRNLYNELVTAMEYYKQYLKNHQNDANAFTKARIGFKKIADSLGYALLLEGELKVQYDSATLQNEKFPEKAMKTYFEMFNQILK